MKIFSLVYCSFFKDATGQNMKSLKNIDQWARIFLVFDGGSNFI